MSAPPPVRIGVKLGLLESQTMSVFVLANINERTDVIKGIIKYLVCVYSPRCDYHQY